MKNLFLSFLVLFVSAAHAATSPQEAYALVTQGEAVFIDVREEHEVKQGMINQAKWFPLSKIEEDEDWQIKFQNIVGGKKIFLYCSTGNRSGKVKKILENHKMASKNLGGYEELKKILPTSREQ